MRIYLSAYRFGPQAESLRTSGGVALVVMNALDEYPERLLNWDREADDLARLGYRPEELDLREHWTTGPGTLRARLGAADMLWVVGGNAFVLARAATAAQLGEALVGAARLTYAGYSAGACLSSIDLAGIEAMDDPGALPDGYSENMAATTLNLTGTRVIPHAGTPDALEARRRLDALALDFVELADGVDSVTERP